MISDVLGHHAARLTAIVLISTVYSLTRPPTLSSVERAELAADFRFTRSALPQVPGPKFRSVRAVHPSLEHISAWISSVGASIALNDLDGDGLPNDLCYVHTSTDQVVVAPVPATGARFEPFTLNPMGLPYDPSTMAPMGCLPGDLNEDGLTDLLVYYWGRSPIAFLQRPAADRLPPLSIHRYFAIETVSPPEVWYTNAAAWADLDGDAHYDLIIGNYFQDGARILDAHGSGRIEMQHSMSRAYNAGSNRLLLWAAATSGTKPSVSFKTVEKVLDERIAHGWTLAVGAADLDGDLYPELYFANDFGPDRLLHNQSRPGKPRFVLLNGVKGLFTPNSKVLGRDSFKGMGVDFGDLNADGWLDIYVSNIAAEYALEESHFLFLSTGKTQWMGSGVAPYVDQSERLGLSRSNWAWESRLADFNNDGLLEALQATGFVKGVVDRWPELHELAMGNDELLSIPTSWPRFQPGDDLSGQVHNPFFVRSSSGRYFDLAPELGLDDSQVSRGIATADVDADGRLDFAVANQWETSYFYRNRAPDPGGYLGLRLRLPPQGENWARSRVWRCDRAVRERSFSAGRPAIGAAAVVHLPDGRRLVGQVDGGNGHSGKRSPELHFGLGHFSRLGDEQKIQVDLQWRDTEGHVHRETLRLPPDSWYTVLLGCEPNGGEIDGCQ